MAPESPWEQWERCYSWQCRGGNARPGWAPRCPRGSLGCATRRVPTSGGTRQPAKSPQSRKAGSCCQISCPYALHASSDALQQGFISPSSLPCHISRRFAARASEPYTTPGPRDQPWVRCGLALPLCSGQGGTWMYRQAL